MTVLIGWLKKDAYIFLSAALNHHMNRDDWILQSGENQLPQFSKEECKCSKVDYLVEQYAGNNKAM